MVYHPFPVQRSGHPAEYSHGTAHRHTGHPGRRGHRHCVHRLHHCLAPEREDDISHLRRANADEIICLNQFGEYLILQSSVSHGVSKLFASLLNFGEEDEIYRIPVPPPYVGRTFRQAFLDLGAKREFILIAAEREGDITVNPKGAYTLQSGDHLFVISPEEPLFEPVGLAQAMA